MAEKKFFIYVLDTKKQADNAQNKVNNLLQQFAGLRYTSPKWFEPVQVPADSPRVEDRSKWVIKLPYELRTKWSFLKIRITELTNYDPDRMHKITRTQWRNIFNLNSPVV